MGGISVILLMGILSVVFYIFLAIFLLIVIYQIITYIFESLAIMEMSKSLQYKAVGTAWIPFYNKYLLGKIANHKVLGVILAILNVAIVVTGIGSYIQSDLNAILFGIFLICIVVSFVLDSIIAHKIYVKAIGKYGDILTVFSVLTLGFLRPIFLFVVRNKVKNEI